MQKDDSQLITGYLEGNEKYLETLIGRYIKPVYNYVYKMVGNAHEAEDISQDAFVKVWKNLKKFKRDMNFSAWLFKIVRNTALDWLRKKRNFAFSAFEDKEGNNVLTDTLVDPEPLPDELIARASDKKMFDQILKKLQPIYREVLVLHYNDHFTLEEIADILNRPLNTIKSQHRRGLILLRTLLVA